MQHGLPCHLSSRAATWRSEQDRPPCGQPQLETHARWHPRCCQARLLSDVLPALASVGMDSRLRCAKPYGHAEGM